MTKTNKHGHRASGLHPAAPDDAAMSFDQICDQDTALLLAGYEKSSIDTLRVIRLYPSPSREIQFTRYVVTTQQIRIARQ